MGTGGAMPHAPPSILVVRRWWLHHHPRTATTLGEDCLSRIGQPEGNRTNLTHLSRANWQWHWMGSSHQLPASYDSYPGEKAEGLDI